MYRIGLSRSFRAFHYLVGDGRGEENAPHAHPYRMEWNLTGPDLGPEGFVADLAALGRWADAVLSEVQDTTLNDHPAFEGGSPTVERLARHLWDRLAAGRGQWDPQRRVRWAEVAILESDSEWGAWSSDLAAGRA